MKVLSGVLTRVGQNTVSLNRGEYSGTESTTYDVIQVGGQILKNMRALKPVGSFMDVGSNVTLYISGKEILGLKLEDGTVIKADNGHLIKQVTVSTFFMLIVGVVISGVILEDQAIWMFVPFVLLTIWIDYMVIREWRKVPTVGKAS